MRVALWLLSLFAVAVAIALFAGDNQGTITLFWPPYRVDLSLNLVLLLLTVLFVTVHLALRSLAALFAMPGNARRWRTQHQERSLYAALLDASSHLVAGRFIRARKAAETVLVREDAMTRLGETLSYSGRLRALAHLLAAEGAHALQDRAARTQHLRQALEHATRRDAQEMREGVQFRAARWALDDRDPDAALQGLDELPHGAARRTIALRLRLKAARMAQQTELALDTARLLIKHRAFSDLAAQGILRSLALELLQSAHDPEQLQLLWLQLDPTERHLPEVATEAASLLLQLDGDVALARSWLLPIWDSLVAQPPSLTPVQRLKLIDALERSFGLAAGAPEPAWLTRIEQAQMRNPGDALLQYLAGVTCMRLKLWGKAQQLIKQALPRLEDVGLQRNALRALAELAEHRGDATAAAQAWREAAKR
jgi:HemY protein